MPGKTKQEIIAGQNMNKYERRRKDVYTEGYDAIVYAIIGQAAEDYKVLSAAGVIQAGKCVLKWPQTRAGKAKKIIDYNSRAMVAELLYFLKCGGMRSLLEQLDSKIDEGRILGKLGLR